MISPPKPPHPGAVLREYLGDLTSFDAAAKLGIEHAKLEAVLSELAPINEEMSNALSAGLGTSDGFWLRLQQQFDRVP